MASRICYIVGAGGSCAYDFPGGQELVDLMTKLAASEGMNNDNICPPQAGALQLLRADLEHSFPPSIDAYIQRLIRNGADPTMSKRNAAAYAMSLIITQCSSRFNLTNGHKEDWLSATIEKHIDNLTSNNPPDISFVTFNYDNLIERFLSHRLRGYLGDRTEKRVSEIPIVHLHGKIQYVDPKKDLGVEIFNDIPYRLELRAREAAESLLFFWETNRAIQAYQEAINLVHNSNCLAIIGVGQAVLPLHTLLSQVDKRWWAHKLSWMTTLGLEPSDYQSLQHLMSGHNSVGTRFFDCKAREFILKKFKP